MTTSETKEYLKKICELESTLYVMCNLRNNINYEMRQLRNYVGENEIPTEYIDKRKDFFEDMETCFYTAITGAVAGAIIGFIALLFGYNPHESFGFLKTIFIRGPLIGAIIASIGMFIFLKWATIQDQKYVKKRNIEIAYENKQIREKNEKEKNRRNTQANMLLIQVNDLNKQIDNTQQVLNKYYKMNILYNKYWNWVAVASFYEYFSSGRCNCFEGHEGAYNIYEQESRQDRILNKLDDVINNLEMIKDSQYMLYSEVVNGNNNIDRLTNNVINCVSSLNNIQTSNQLIEYNTKVSAQNTEYLKWLTILS